MFCQVCADEGVCGQGEGGTSVDLTGMALEGRRCPFPGGLIIEGQRDDHALYQCADDIVRHQSEWMHDRIFERGRWN